MPPLDFSHAQPIDHAVGHLAPAAPDCNFAHEIQTQVSASMAQPMPGAESLMAAPGMPPVPGAEQAVSPLIQMIMRMPGHIGLASSFFEALSHFFLPQTDMLTLFDPSQFGLHFDLSSVTPEHGSIDFSLLPHDAPILDHLGSVDLGGAHSLDLASDKLNISLGGDSHFIEGNGTGLSLGSQYNVSGAASMARPQFEGAGGLVSGPNVSSNFSADSLASNNRLFSDGQTISSASNNMMIAGGNASSGMLAAPSLSQSASAASLSNSVNTGGSTLAGHSAATGMVENVSAQGTSANNVSYNVFEKLAGNKEILAANNVSDSYHSTIGTIQPDAPMDNVSHSAAPQATSHSATSGGDNFGGLKAKPMSLDGSKMELKADHAKLDPVADHKAAHSVEHQAEHPVEHKIDHTAEHKVEHASVSKPEHATAQKVEHAAQAHATQQPVEHVAHEAAKPVEKITHEAAKSAAQPVVHNATNSPAHAATAAPVHHPSHIADHTRLAEAHPPAAQHAVDVKHAANPASHAAPKQFDAGQLVQPTSMQPHVQPHGTPTEAVQNASAVDAQNQFGDPVNGASDATNSASTGDATTGHTGDAAANANANAGDGQTQDGSGQTLEQQQTPVAKAYTIRSGDCLWNIAKDQLGDATKWSDIYKVNVDVLGSNPSLIHPGVSIQMPGAEGAVSGNIAHYTVKAGDNLWNIAKAQFGDATKWGDLYKANQDIIGANPDLIRPGQELTFTTGGADPTGNALSSSATGTTAPSGSLAQAPAPAGHAAAAPAAHAGGDAQVSQNSAPIDTYGAPPTPELNANSIQSASSSDINFEPAQIQHNIQPPQAPSVTPVKVMPVEAQPDAIIQPAHAADLSGINNASHEAANAAHSLTQSQKHGMVDSSVGSDLLSALNKRR